MIYSCINRNNQQSIAIHSWSRHKVIATLSACHLLFHTLIALLMLRPRTLLSFSPATAICQFQYVPNFWDCLKTPSGGSWKRIWICILIKLLSFKNWNHLTNVNVKVYGLRSIFHILNFENRLVRTGFDRLFLPL